MNSKVYKWCMVPQCGNTSIKTPNKLFFYVPNDKNMRKKWLQLARRDPAAIATNSSIYFCEDHFDLPNDMKNYMEYHIMGSVSKLLTKPGCIPTKFDCQPDRRKRTSNIAEQPYILKKRPKLEVEESLMESEVSTEQYVVQTVAIEYCPSRSPDVLTSHENLQDDKKTTEKSIQVDMKYKLCSKGTQTNLCCKPASIKIKSIKQINLTTNF